MAKRDSYGCPTCGHEVDFRAKRCPMCQADVTDLAMFLEMSSSLFNESLAFLKTNRPHDAVFALRLGLFLRPGDAAAWVLLGKIFAKANQAEQARACFSNAVMHDQADPAAKAALLASGGKIMTIGRKPF